MTNNLVAKNRPSAHEASRSLDNKPTEQNISQISYVKLSSGVNFNEIKLLKVHNNFYTPAHSSKQS